MADVYGATFDLHTQTMSFLWCPVVDIIIIIGTFTSSRFAFYLHAIGGWMLTVFSLMITLPILATSGIVPSSNDAQAHNHILMGLVCVTLIVGMIISGVLSRLVNILPTKSALVINIHKAHKIFGLTLAILAKITVMYIIYEVDRRNLLLILQVPLILFYFYRKFYNAKLQEVSQYHEIKSDEHKKIKKVYSLQQLIKEGKSDLVIFENYIYDLQPLKNWHPAGYQIVQSVKNHQIDKFIYGMQSAYEFPMIDASIHSRLSLSLLDSPIAKLQIQSCYQNLGDSNEVTIKDLKLITAKGSIYQMYLQSSKPFIFKAYTEIKQLGRHYSLTLDQSVTRLYTSVNFLHFNNIKFLSQYLQGQQVKKYASERLSYATEIPILFRRYKEGKITTSLTEKTARKIQLSCEKGEGLQLDAIEAGKIIIVAGGTGVYPFSDLIDHLYKRQLLKQNASLQKQIAQLSPLILDKHFQKLKFVFMLSFNHIEQIHPITLQQLLSLGKQPQHSEVILRIKQNWNHQIVNNIRMINDRFENLLEPELDISSLKKVIVCGPPRMNQQIHKLLKQRLSPDRFMIL